MYIGESNSVLKWDEHDCCFLQLAPLNYQIMVAAAKKVVVKELTFFYFFGTKAKC